MHMIYKQRFREDRHRRWYNLTEEEEVDKRRDGRTVLTETQEPSGQQKVKSVTALAGVE